MRAYFSFFLGGGIYFHGETSSWKISNNVIEENTGAYAGAIRVGSAWLKEGSDNDDLVIAHNVIRHNAGANLAGAIGLFAGTNNYLILNNLICGNHGMEYGGGISHFGTSKNGRISNNEISWNFAFDEGGGILIGSEEGGQVPGSPRLADAGDVIIDNNWIQGCLSNDDGGGIRFLNPGLSSYLIINNVVVNNVATQEGGGISLNDAPNVMIFYNIIARNLVTGTNAGTDQIRKPAGLCSALHSDDILEVLPAGSSPFSDPIVRNNIFWENRAGTDLNGISDSDPFHYDIGINSDDTIDLTKVSHNIIQSDLGYSGYNSHQNPKFASDFEISATTLFSNLKNTKLFTYLVVPPNTLNTLGSKLGNWESRCPLNFDSIGSSVATMITKLGGHVEESPLLMTDILGNNRPLSSHCIGPYTVCAKKGSHKRSIFDTEEIETEVSVPSVSPATFAVVGALMTLVLLMTGLQTSKTSMFGFTFSEKFLNSKFRLGVTATPSIIGLSVFICFLMLAPTASATATWAPTRWPDVPPKISCPPGLIYVGQPGWRYNYKSLTSIGYFGQTNDDDAILYQQFQFLHELPIPKIVNLSCGDSITVYMKEGTQFMGMYDALNGNMPVNTTVWGYAVGDDAPLYPGPTIAVPKDCTVNITWVNMLPSKHMFPMDRTVYCNTSNLCATSSEMKSAQPFTCTEVTCAPNMTVTQTPGSQTQTVSE